ncbi:MAG: beta-ketoacyl synthase N-terminal-like domain-containing protein, partial [Pseudomonadota bacterium]
AEQIRWNKQDIMFVGGGEELDWTMSVLFDAMQALSSQYNDTPEKASRAYDQDRDGFVIAGGGGVLVLEELEHARARGAKIYAEIAGYGATSDGYDMVQPSGEGAARCMQMALDELKSNHNTDKVDYINAHGTSTPIGDVREAKVIAELFKQDQPYVASTKSMTGHSLGAAGVHEAIYTLLMMKHRFIAPSINIETLDHECKNIRIADQIIENFDINVAMSNSFGFGGTNCSLILKSYK